MERGVGAGKVAKNTIRKTKARKKVTTDDFDLSDEEILAQQQQQGAVVKKKAGKKRKVRLYVCSATLMDIVMGDLLLICHCC